MKNVIEILERQYQSFINQERDWNFFVGLVDYVSFLKENPDIEKKFDKIDREKEKEYKIVKEYEQKALRELDEIKNKILKIVKSNKVNFKELPEALLYLKNCEKGIINPTYYKSARLEGGLKNLFKSLIKNGFMALLKNYLPEDVISGNPEDKYFIESLDYKLDLSPFSEAFNSRQLKCMDIGDKKSTTLWGALDKLYTLRRVIFDDNENGVINAKRFKELSGEIGLIKNDGDDDGYGFASYYMQEKKKFSSSNNPKIREFKKDNYKLYATRIHNYLIQELSKKEDEKIEEKRVNYTPLFDADKSILIIGDKKIKIKKFSDQYHLLRIIFESESEFQQEWFFSEIAERYDSEANLSDKKFYNAVYQLNQKVARETGIKDYFITTSQSFKINPEYA